MDSILLVGEDPRLLETRAAVLARTGAAIISCNKAEFPRCADARPFRLVVLCHSLAPETKQSLPTEIHRRWPGVCVVQVATLRESYDDLSTPADAVTPSNPAELLNTVSRLLQQPLRLRRTSSNGGD